MPERLLSLSGRGAVCVALACAILWTLNGCTLILDLPADCTPADCGGFQCAPSGAECLFVCREQTDCADGFVCDDLRGTRGDGACIPRGCGALGPASQLFSGAAALRDVDVAPSAEGETVAAVYVSGGQIVLQTFRAADGSLGLDVSVDAPATPPRDPALASNGQGWGVVWKASALFEGRQRDVLRYAYVGEDGQVLVPAKTVWVAGYPGIFTEKSVDTPEIAWDAEKELFILVFSARLDFNGELFMLPIHADGTSLEGEVEVPHQDARLITINTGGALDPVVVVRELPDDAPDLYDVSYRAGSASIGLVFQTVSVDAQKPGGGDITLVTPEDGARVDSYGMVDLGGARAIAWSDTNAAGAAVRRSLISPERAQSGEPRAVAMELDNPSGADVAASIDNAEFAVVQTGELRGQRSVFMTRFGADGGRLNATIPVTGDDVTPANPRVVATLDGYLIIWEVTVGASAGTIAGQYWDCGLR